MSVFVFQYFSGTSVHQNGFQLILTARHILIFNDISDDLSWCIQQNLILIPVIICRCPQFREHDCLILIIRVLMLTDQFPFTISVAVEFLINDQLPTSYFTAICLQQHSHCPGFSFSPESQFSFYQYLIIIHEISLKKILCSDT